MRKDRYQAATHARRRFVGAVALPIALLALGLTATVFYALNTASRQADLVSANRQGHEAQLALDDALDELAQSQSGVAIWSPLLRELYKPRPDWNWIDTNAGTLLNYVFAHDVDIILSPDDIPVYMMQNGVRRTAPTRAAHLYLRAAAPLIDAVRARTRRLPNRHERLPGQPIAGHSTVRTSPNAIHATSTVAVGQHPAAISVMRIVPDGSDGDAPAGAAPLLLSVRYLDRSFARQLASVQLLAGARATIGPLRSGEHGVALIAEDGARVGTLAWRPARPGLAVWKAMVPTAAAVLAGLLATVAALLGGVGRLMRKDAATLDQLRVAHLELQAKEAQAHRLAYHDPLTGLANRTRLIAALDDMVGAGAADGVRAVLLIDLDRFKQVNDTLGHLGGDQLIRQVAMRLEALVLPGDLVARLGGDEFAVLLGARSDEAAVEAVAVAMVSAIREPFVVLGASVHIGTSIGIACFRDAQGDRTELMRTADIAMYRVKADGRNGHRFFAADMDESVKLRREIEEDLRAALTRDGELLVHYQPQMDGSGNRVIGVEALLRWQHPHRGWLAPAAFINVAEESGLIGALTRRVLRDACGIAVAWPGLSVAVNISPVQFRSRTLANELIAIVRETGARAQQIELEVTESVLLDNDEVVRTTLGALRRAGFRIALDDFGTGYSSLSYLSKFEVDKIKIDRSFIQRLGEADDAAAIIHAVVRLGHAMGLRVTAEGVETGVQRAFLEHAGCNELQGFLFSEAVPPAALERLLGRLERAA
ncbi:putative bifunctional diguanylate cyclase/phosphodiesterase [Sphingomonas sp. 8AM]|uniref:putative bifunctional diguanylate cyclase/phosphodiesterase n=1 Tax=Sphingomonas sp. 8AM TaxID=2653170 RepID=UPI001359F065|nr:EAL domain-containing protein [Sphingomonas sp. 8AM]